jgi:hypothetical protein
MSKEKWKKIASFPGYAVSSHGRVSGRQKALLTPFIGGNGHPSVYLYRDGGAVVRRESVHVLVLETFFGPRPKPGMQGRHLNGKKTVNRLSNLKWGTPLENVHDAMKHGVHVRPKFGEKHMGATITDAVAKEIKRRLAEGLTTRQIVDATGVKRHTVNNIKAGRSFRLVTAS